MRKLIVFASALLLTASARAEDYPYLSFESTDGSVVSVSVESLEMTFSDGKLVLRNGTDSKELTVADLSRMFFSSSATSISEIQGGADAHRVKVYTLAGTYVGTFDSLQQAKSGLCGGMYVIKDNNNTTKIAVR